MNKINFVSVGIIDAVHFVHQHPTWETRGRDAADCRMLVRHEPHRFFTPDELTISMANYRRTTITGATYFFTVNCIERQGNALLTEHIDQLRQVFRKVKNDHPFTINAIVVLPEHLHCIWTLPQDDADYKTRWALIKAGFSRQIPSGESRSESRSESRIQRGERGVWQRRYWEHLIRNDLDYQKHVNYIHWNPVKHGWVQQVKQWPHSSFHNYVRQGICSSDWAGESDHMGDFGEMG